MAPTGPHFAKAMGATSNRMLGSREIYLLLSAPPGPSVFGSETQPRVVF